MQDVSVISEKARKSKKGRKKKEKKGKMKKGKVSFLDAVVCVRKHQFRSLITLEGASMVVTS
jgi:hypothetical protein